MVLNAVCLLVLFSGIYGGHIWLHYFFSCTVWIFLCKYYAAFWCERLSYITITHSWLSLHIFPCMQNPASGGANHTFEVSVQLCGYHRLSQIEKYECGAVLNCMITYSLIENRIIFSIFNHSNLKITLLVYVCANGLPHIAFLVTIFYLLVKYNSF